MTAHSSTEAISIEKLVHTYSSDIKKLKKQFPSKRERERNILFEPAVPIRFFFPSLDLFILIRHGHREHLGSFPPRFATTSAPDQIFLYCDSEVGFLDRYKEQAGQ